MPKRLPKVLYLIPATGMGGFERLFYNSVHIRNLFPGVVFASIYAYLGDPRNAQLRAAGVRIIFEMKVNRWKNIFLFHHLALVKIISLIRSQGIKIFHAQDNFTMLYGLIAKLVCGVKLIRTHHGAENHYWAADNFFFRMLGGLVDMNVFVSRSFLHTFAANNHVHPKSIKHRIVYNGVLCPAWDEPLPAKPDSLELIMVGNYSGGRDHLFAVKVLQGILGKFPQARLTLVGNPNPAAPVAFDKCNQYISDNSLNDHVRVLTGVTDVLPLLRESDLFIYESTRDTFGIAIVEAMLSGVPCLVNDLDTFIEISRQGSLCTLFSTGDLNDCINKAHAILDDLPTYKKRASQMIPQVLDLYSMEGYAKNLMKVYDEVLANG